MLKKIEPMRNISAQSENITKKLLKNYHGFNINEVEISNNHILQRLISFG